MKSSQFHLEVLFSFLALTLVSFINATPITAPLGAINIPRIFNQSVAPLSLNARQNQGQDIEGQDLEIWQTTYYWYETNNGVPTQYPIQVCQGALNLNPWVLGKSICTWTFVWQPAWGRACEMYLFDQSCHVIGQNLGDVTLDDLADPNGWGFASQLPYYLLVNIPSDPNTVVNNDVTFWYNEETYTPWDGLPTNYGWLFSNGFSWSGTFGIFTVIRMSFAC
jgi:hypothetical protein